MSIETAIRELDEICDFLKGHESIHQATYNLTHENMTVIVEITGMLPGLNVWLDQIEPRLQAIFDRPVNYEIISATSEKTQLAIPNQEKVAESNSFDETESSLSDRKLISNTTYIFSSFDSNYRLMRMESERKTFESDETYFKESNEISEQEAKSINKLFQVAVNDYKAGKMIKNFVEINVNNAKSEEILSKFAFIFRQVPKQFTDRFIISLVRIPSEPDQEVINRAIAAFKQITPKVFLSLELDTYLKNQPRFNDLQTDGFLITAGNPQRKDIAGQIRKANFKQITKEVFLVYYTRDWKEIPSNNPGLTPMYMKTKTAT
ncbi:MAG: hypothetical protein ACRBBN_05905 [Methyloligellaceae bacterium]